MARALTEMHQAEVVHRDIKPENLFLHNGVLKIGDFGLSISVEKSRTEEVIAGSPLYMAPEALRYGTMVDLWSTGVVFYQVFLKHHPYETVGLQTLKLL